MSVIRAPLLSLLALLAAAAAADEWPTVRHDIARTGYTADFVRPPVKLAWQRSFENGPIATCVEPIVAEGKVFVSSLNGTLYAVQAADGSDLWQFSARGPLLHSPAYEKGKVYVGSVDGGLYCLDAASGAVRWRFDGGRGGFAASPTVENGVVYIGSRGGIFHAIRDEGDRASQVWSFDAGAPIWQTAALARRKVYFTAENLVAHALKKELGIRWWHSRPMSGYKARDYYPCVLGEHVVFRTSPADGEERVIKEGGAALLRVSNFAGKNEVVIARKLDAVRPWDAPGVMVESEATGLESFLTKDRPEHRTFYIFTAEDGVEVPAPLLWTGGCGGVASPPAAARDGSVYVAWRSLFTGWIERGTAAVYGTAPRHGIARIPLGTGMPRRFDPAVPGKVPWGVFLMSNEANTLQVGGNYLYIVHQSTLCALDLATRRISVLLGTRDLWGGQPALGWAANEWRGPARGGIAIAGRRAYWIVGSHLLALEGTAE